MRIIRSALAATALAAMVAGAGCAYYNTFFNAKQAFSEAEELGENIDPRNRPSSAQRPKYQAAINKCQLLLEEYPDSKHVDDALFLMGKAQFRLKEHRKAIRNFDNVLVNFPRSKHGEEALYLRSVAHLELGEEQISLDLLRRLREGYPDSRYTIEALYRLGDTYYGDERYDQALDYYVEYLENYPKHEARPRVLLDVGRIYVELERHEEAAEILGTIDEDKATREQRFDAQFVRAGALNKVGRTQEAADLLAGIAGDAASFGQRGQTLVLEGEIQLKLGNEEQGLSILEAAATEFKSEPVEAAARYAIAQHTLETQGPGAEGILDQLRLAIENRAQGERADDVRELHGKILRHEQLSEQLAEPDSSSFGAAFQLAELLFVDLDKPQAALKFYRQVLDDYPDSPPAPRAAYAVGYIESQVLGDSVSAELAYDLLRDRYGDSPQAQALDGAMFLEARPPELNPDAGLGAEGPTGASPNDNLGPRRGFRDPSGRPAADPNRSLSRGGPGSLRPR